MDCEGDHPRGGNPFDGYGFAACVPGITAEKMVWVQMDTAWVHDLAGATFGLEKNFYVKLKAFKARPSPVVENAAVASMRSVIG